MNGLRGPERAALLTGTDARARTASHLQFAPAMTQARISLGKRGEDLACEELERRGYAIVARRFRVRSGELDIVARDGATLVFVEVKARTGRAFGDAAEAVTPLKQLRLTRLATEYLLRHHLQDCPCRFDVVSIHFDASVGHAGAAEVAVIQNAFDA
jgi:putative endonuclease